MQSKTPAYPLVTSLPTLLALLCLLFLPQAGVAQTSTCQGETVDPGTAFCGPRLLVSSYATVTGSSDASVVFSVYVDDGVHSLMIFTLTGTSFIQSWDSTGNPALFPGTFQVCAFRHSAKTSAAHVQNCISGR